MILKMKNIHTPYNVSIWLICRDGGWKGKVLLQQKSATEVVDGVKHPYVYQPSWNGRIEPNEGLPETVTIGRTGSLDILEIFSVNGKGPKLGYHYVGLVSRERLKGVKLHPGAIRTIAVGVKDLPRIKALGSQKANPKDEIVMFGNHRKALIALFRLQKILSFLGK